MNRNRNSNATLLVVFLVLFLGFGVIEQLEERGLRPKVIVSAEQTAEVLVRQHQVGLSSNVKRTEFALKNQIVDDIARLPEDPIAKRFHTDLDFSTDVLDDAWVVSQSNPVVVTNGRLLAPSTDGQFRMADPLRAGQILTVKTLPRDTVQSCTGRLRIFAGQNWQYRLDLPSPNAIRSSTYLKGSAFDSVSLNDINACPEITLLNMQDEMHVYVDGAHVHNIPKTVSDESNVRISVRLQNFVAIGKLQVWEFKDPLAPQTSIDTSVIADLARGTKLPSLAVTEIPVVTATRPPGLDGMLTKVSADKASATERAPEPTQTPSPTNTAVADDGAVSQAALSPSRIAYDLNRNGIPVNDARLLLYEDFSSGISESQLQLLTFNYEKGAGYVLPSGVPLGIRLPRNEFSNQTLHLDLYDGSCSGQLWFDIGQIFRYVGQSSEDALFWESSYLTNLRVDVDQVRLTDNRCPDIVFRQQDLDLEIYVNSTLVHRLKLDEYPSIYDRVEITLSEEVGLNSVALFENDS